MSDKDVLIARQRGEIGDLRSASVEAREHARRVGRGYYRLVGDLWKAWRAAREAKDYATADRLRDIAAPIEFTDRGWYSPETWCGDDP